MKNGKRQNRKTIPPGTTGKKVTFEAFGEEMLDKKVRQSGNSGRIYLPPHWVGHPVKIIRVE